MFTLTIQQKEALKELIKGIYPDKEEFLRYIHPFLTHITIHNKYEKYLTIIQKMGIHGIEEIVELFTGGTEDFIENSGQLMDVLYAKMTAIFSGNQKLPPVSEFMNVFMEEFSFMNAAPYMAEPTDMVYKKYGGLIYRLDDLHKLSAEEQSICHYFQLLLCKLWVASVLTMPRYNETVMYSFLKNYLITYYRDVRLLYTDEYMSQEFIQYIENIKIPNEEKLKNTLLFNNNTNVFGSNPFFQYANEIFSLLKARFNDVQHESLRNILNMGKSNEILIFMGRGNQLADVFKQLYESNLITRCSKQELIIWIKTYFKYNSGEGDINFKEDYLNNIISTNATPCKNPIIGIKKEDEKVIIYSPDRKGRSQL